MAVELAVQLAVQLAWRGAVLWFPNLSQPVLGLVLIAEILKPQVFRKKNSTRSQTVGALSFVLSRLPLAKKISA